MIPPTYRLREERICKQCTLGEVEDEVHFVLKCEALSEERRNFLRHIWSWWMGGRMERKELGVDIRTRLY